MSPLPESPLELQQFTPLWALTIREGSAALTASAIRPLSSRSHSPQPSLKTTLPMTEGALWCCRIASMPWSTNAFWPVVLVMFPETKSCQTSRPSRSAW